MLLMGYHNYFWAKGYCVDKYLASCLRLYFRQFLRVFLRNVLFQSSGILKQLQQLQGQLQLQLQGHPVRRDKSARD